jgi:hypothetical protein
MLNEAMGELWFLVGLTGDPTRQSINGQKTKNGYEISAIKFGFALGKSNRRCQIIPPLLRLQSDRLGPLNWNTLCRGSNGSERPGTKGRQRGLEPGGSLPQRGSADRSIESFDERGLSDPGGFHSPRPVARAGGLFIRINLRARLRATRRGLH